jgi:hypothetical protein
MTQKAQLSLSALRQRFVHAAETANLPTSSWLMTRRAFIQATALIPAAAVLARSSRVGFRRERTSAIFTIDGHDAWRIDALRFAGTPRLSSNHSQSQIYVRLDGARFPGTNVAVDLTCRCALGASGWLMHLSVTSLDTATLLEPFLLGTEAAHGYLALEGNLLRTPNASLEIPREAVASFDRDWTLRVDAPARFEAGRRLDAESISIGLPAAHAPDVIEGRGRRSVIELRRGDRAWSLWPAKRAVGNIVLTSDPDPFDRTTIDLREQRGGSIRAAMMAEGTRDGVVSARAVTPIVGLDDAPFIVPLRNVVYASTFGDVDPESVLMADGLAEPRWLRAHASLMQVSAPPNAPLFELHERDGQPVSVQFAPMVSSSLVPLPDALTEPAAPHTPTRVDLALCGEGTSAGATIEPCDGKLQVCIDNACISVLRPEDLLSLRFELHNLRVVKHPFQKATIERCSANDSYVVVVFPPQYIAERAFIETEQIPEVDPVMPPPIESRMAGASRVALRLRPELNEIAYSLQSLLSWDHFELSAVTPMLPRKEINAPPGPTETAIELPYHLILSPDAPARWLHSTEAQQRDGRVELWHSRLVSAGDPLQRPAIRAVWSPDFISDPATVGAEEPANAECPFRMSLNGRDRHRVVRLTHDASTNPEPARANLFLLSSLGAWIDLEGKWEWTKERKSVPLERWEHLTTMGRDQHVVVENRGYLYPFGHRATLVKETERKVIAVPGGSGKPNLIAYLRQRFYILIKEKTRTYDRIYDWPMSWVQVTATELRSPLLDFETANGVLKISGAIPRRNPAPAALDVQDCAMAGGDWDQSGFWPTVRGEPYRFAFEGRDQAGGVQKFKATVIFVEDRDTNFCDCEPGPCSASGTVPCVKTRDCVPASLRQLEHDATCAYHENPPRRHSELRGQTVALAKKVTKGDTEVQASEVSFFSRRITPIGHEPGFHPLLEKIHARVPALDQLLGGGGGGQAWLAVRNPDDDAREVFAAILKDQGAGDAIEAGFHTGSDRSGGVAAPTINVSHLSRRFGPIGLGTREPDPIILPPLTLPPMTSAAPPPLGPISASDFFDPNATVLGSIKLSDIVNPLDVLQAEAMPAILALLTERGDAPTQVSQSISWATKGMHKTSFGSFFVFNPEEGELVIDGRFDSYLDAGLPVQFSMRGSLKNFFVELNFGSLGGVRVKFNEFAYVTGTNMPARTIVDLGPVTFLGALEFVQNITRNLQLGNDVNISLAPDGLLIQLPPIRIPDLNIGAFGLSGLLITTWCTLPFTPEPMQFGFELGQANRPFLVTVGPYSGGGFFGIVVDTSNNGIRRMQAAIEFGAMKEISFGSVAHGQLYVFGGLYYSQERVTDTVSQTSFTKIIFKAYVRAGGEIEALGLITLAVDLYVGLEYIDGSLFGRAILTYSFKIGFVKKSFSITYEQRFAGSTARGARLAAPRDAVVLGFQADVVDHATPTSADVERIVRFSDSATPAQWESYWTAFVEVRA